MTMRSHLLRSIPRAPALRACNGCRRPARTFATTSIRQADVELTVDGKKVSVPRMYQTGRVVRAGIVLLLAC
jgi:NADH dehydrogenase (ubiquinone) Fe-S protein 1